MTTTTMPPLTDAELTTDAADTPLVQIPRPEPSPLALVAEAIAKGHSPEKLNALLDFAERFEKKVMSERFAAALAGFQGECRQILKERIVKTREGKDIYAFASYDDIKKAIAPLQRKFGIVTTFTAQPTMTNGLLVGTIRVQVGSHFQDTTLPIPIPQGMNTNKAQEYGMAVKYLQRYLLCMALDIVTTDEDDDGASLGDFINGKQIEEINGLIDQCEKVGKPVDFPRFLKWLGIDSLDKLPQRDLEKALTELRRKLKEVVK